MNINWIIAKYRGKYNPNDFEVGIRKKKLNEAEKAKQDLEAKLQGIKDSITELKDTETQGVRKLNLMSSELRQDYYESERIKTEEVAKTIRKYGKQQKKLEEAINKNVKRIEKQQKMQLEEEKYNAQYEIFLRKERIKEEREKMLEKKKKRLDEQENLKKSQSQSRLAKKPLFQIFEEKFNTEIVMPELERRKEELKKKREMFMPIQSDRIKEHREWYESVKEKHKEKFEHDLMRKIKEERTREKSLYEGSFSAKAIDEKRIFQERELRILNEKREKIERMKNYADIAQEMYNPSLDKDNWGLVNKEMKKKKKKEKKLKKMKNFKSDGESQEKFEWKPKKFKPNSCIPPKKNMILPKVVDYLAQKRLNRGSEDLARSQHRIDLTKSPDSDFTSFDLQKIKKNAMKLEELAHKKSLRITKSPNNLESLHETQSVDDLLIGSIRAKLLVLNHLD